MPRIRLNDDGTVTYWASTESDESVTKECHAGRGGWVKDELLTIIGRLEPRFSRLDLMRWPKASLCLLLQVVQRKLEQRTLAERKFEQRKLDERKLEQRPLNERKLQEAALERQRKRESALKRRKQALEEMKQAAQEPWELPSSQKRRLERLGHQARTISPTAWLDLRRSKQALFEQWGDRMLKHGLELSSLGLTVAKPDDVQVMFHDLVPVGNLQLFGPKHIFTVQQRSQKENPRPLAHLREYSTPQEAKHEFALQGELGRLMMQGSTLHTGGIQWVYQLVGNGIWAEYYPLTLHDVFEKLSQATEVQAARLYGVIQEALFRSLYTLVCLQYYSSSTFFEHNDLTARNICLLDSPVYYHEVFSLRFEDHKVLRYSLPPSRLVACLTGFHNAQIRTSTNDQNFEYTHGFGFDDVRSLVESVYQLCELHGERNVEFSGRAELITFLQDLLASSGRTAVESLYHPYFAQYRQGPMEGYQWNSPILPRNLSVQRPYLRTHDVLNDVGTVASKQSEFDSKDLPRSLSYSRSGSLQGPPSVGSLRGPPSDGIQRDTPSDGKRERPQSLPKSVTDRPIETRISPQLKGVLVPRGEWVTVPGTAEQELHNILPLVNDVFYPIQIGEVSSGSSSSNPRVRRALGRVGRRNTKRTVQLNPPVNTNKKTVKPKRTALAEKVSTKSGRQLRSAVPKGKLKSKAKKVGRKA